MAPDKATTEAVRNATEIAVEAAIKNTAPLADFDEFQAADDAAAEVTA